MTNQELQKLINEAHDNAVKHGFYEGLEKCSDTYEKLLMLIISEISEFMEADRAGKWFLSGDLLCVSELNQMLEGQVSYSDFEEYYKRYVKGCAEEELADVCIRCFDMLGYIGPTDVSINHNYVFAENCSSLSVPSLCYNLCAILACNQDESYLADSLMVVVKAIVVWCMAHKVDLMPHIKAKMLYNKNRPYKHGKEY